jgi:hypothetical protein
MGEVIDFPAGLVTADHPPHQSKQKQEALEQDPYYLFIHSVLSTADSCGFQLPFTLDSAAEHVYKKTRHTSQLAKLLDKKLRGNN